jgi:hypothetical protein
MASKIFCEGTAYPQDTQRKGKDVGEEKGSGKTNAALQWVAGGKKEGTVFMVALFSRSSSDSSSLGVCM